MQISEVAICDLKPAIPCLLSGTCGLLPSGTRESILAPSSQTTVLMYSPGNPRSRPGTGRCIVYDDSVRQAIIDEEHLKLLSLGYLISAGISAFFSLFGLMYVFMGAMFGAIARMPASQNNQPPPPFVGWLLAGFGAAFVVVFLVLALLKFKVARSIKRRQSRTFCLVIAAISCLGVPYGTVLGVFTFMVLGRDAIIRRFEPQPVSAPVA